jgi:LCP family protein required for cell wall assembly
MNRDNKYVIPVAVIFVLMLAAVIGFLAGNASHRPAQRTQPETEQSENPAGASDLEADDEEWEGTVVYNGQEYVKNRDLKTVLFLGIDDVPAQGDLIGKGGRSDAIVLLIVDKKNKTARMLEISRDTMTDVDVYDNDGAFLYTAHMQLCMQYAFGDSPKRSCFLTKKKISDLLYGLDIDYCASLTMEGIAVIVDGMGGVTLTMPEDLTEIDPSYVEGATVHMDGAEVERFVRARDKETTGGNTRRMERQNWFLLELVRQIKHNSQLSVSGLVDLAKPYMETDLDADTLTLLHDCALSSDSLKVPGESKLGELHDEYYIDDDALQELMIQLFYLPKS